MNEWICFDVDHADAFAIVVYDAESSERFPCCKKRLRSTLVFLPAPNNSVRATDVAGSSRHLRFLLKLRRQRANSFCVNGLKTAEAMRGSFSAQGRSGSRQNAYSPTEIPSSQEPTMYHGKMRTAPENASAVDIILGVSADTIHAITVHQHKMMFQSPIGLLKEVVWDHSEKSLHFVLDDGSTSPTFVFPVLTELEAQFTAILALPDLEKPPEQVYIGVLIGQNLPSPIQQRRASLGSSQPTILPMSKRRELLRREQPVKNAMSRERLGIEYIRSGYLCFTCSISGDLRGLTLGVHHIRVFPSPDCHDRSACLFSYSYEHLESCEVSGTRLELRFRTTHQLAKQPSYLVFQSLEAQYIREAIWYLKNGTYMDASIRDMLASPTRTPQTSSNDSSPSVPDFAASRRGSVLMFFTDADSLKQRIDSCCRVIGCQYLVDTSDQSGSKPEEASASNMMVHINSGELSHMNPSVRTNPSTSRVLTNGLCELHASCLSSASSEPLQRQRLVLSREKLPLPAKNMQLLITLLQSTHYPKMFKFQGQLMKRQNARTFHLRKAWHPKFVVLFETPVGGFLCYYDKLMHCPGMTDMPKERRVIDLSSVLCIRPVSAASPVSRSSTASAPTMHAFDVVTLYRTWTFAALEPEEYEVWLHVLTECVEKHATIAPDKVLRFPVKLAMTGQSLPTEATSLEISSHGVSFCTGHEAEVVLSTWYYTDLEKWSVVFQQGYTCCLLKCRTPAPVSPGSPRTNDSDMITQDYLFRTSEASVVCLAIEFYVGKCMAKLEVLAGQYLEESRAHKSKTTLVGDPKRGPNNPKLQLHMEHPIENVPLAPIGSPERPTSPPAQPELLMDLRPIPERIKCVTPTQPEVDHAATRTIEQVEYVPPSSGYQDNNMPLSPSENPRMLRTARADITNDMDVIPEQDETVDTATAEASLISILPICCLEDQTPPKDGTVASDLEDEEIVANRESAAELLASTGVVLRGYSNDESMDAYLSREVKFPGTMQKNEIDATSSAAVDETPCKIQDVGDEIKHSEVSPMRDTLDRVEYEEQADNDEEETPPVGVIPVSQWSEFEATAIDFGDEDHEPSIPDEITQTLDEGNTIGPSFVPLPESLLAQPAAADTIETIHLSTNEFNELDDATEDSNYGLLSPTQHETYTSEMLDRVPEATSDVFMVEFRADVLVTPETCVDIDNVSTTSENLATAEKASNDDKDSIQSSQACENSTRSPGLLVPLSPPLLLLEYIPSWQGEPQQPPQTDKEVELVPPHDEDNDTRESECEVSDQSDAFNSCASEVNLLLESTNAFPETEDSNTVPPTDCTDDVFEDAIDPDAKEDRPDATNSCS
ncbi:unnamed protein product [Phytophthora lilii]|uniref:Unnamed protein product n=1 Tax=Phytophthora lilii TaxID=2077276 RepID=A0A9W6TIS8_9STRA|nr:unnamed protein product [Phytophthora lilii]